MRVPNVGEYLSLRAEAIRAAVSRSVNGKPSDVEIGVELGGLIVRRQLAAITPEPVESIYKPGFDRARALADLEAKAKENTANGGPEVDIEASLAATEDANEDIEATIASARPEPVTDLSWDEQEGAVGTLLAAMPLASLDSPEGADWEKLNDYASFVMPASMRGLAGPKAPGRPRIRSLRLSVAG